MNKSLYILSILGTTKLTSKQGREIDHTPFKGVVSGLVTTCTPNFPPSKDCVTVTLRPCV